MGCGGGKETLPDIVINLNEPEPTENEVTMVQEALKCISKTGKLLDLITGYNGCEAVIREALSNPGNQEIESNAFKEVSDVVDVLYKFYEFSLKLDEIWSQLINATCSDDPETSIGNQNAIVKQMAEIFKFVFLFDAQKIVHPSIQNDFSYFRRVYHRMKNQAKKKKKKKLMKNLQKKCLFSLLILLL